MKVNIKDKDGLTEEEFIKAYNPARYERPSVTNDIIIFTTELLVNYRNGYYTRYEFAGVFAEKRTP